MSESNSENRHEATQDESNQIGRYPPRCLGDIARHPVSMESVREDLFPDIDLWQPRIIAMRRKHWWGQYQIAATDEERLTCQRIIDFLGMTIRKLNARRRSGDREAAGPATIDADKVIVSIGRAIIEVRCRQ